MKKSREPTRFLKIAGLAGGGALLASCAPQATPAPAEQKPAEQKPAETNPPSRSDRPC